MNPSSTRCVLCLLLSSLAACAAPRAAPRSSRVAELPPTASAEAAAVAPAPQGRPSAKNHLDVMFGGSYWDDLGDVDGTTAGPILGAIGDFDSWGWAFDFGYDRVVWSGRDVDFSVGVESGWSTFYNDGFGYYGTYSEITGSMWYVAPAARWHFELSRQASLIAGVGAGYYGFSVDELTTQYYGWWWDYDSRTLTQDSALGGFASLAFDFNVSPGGAFRIDNKVHFVDFDGLSSALLDESSVQGPIWTFEIGYVFKF